LRALYRVWLEGRDHMVDEIVSPSLADAIARAQVRGHARVVVRRVGLAAEDVDDALRCRPSARESKC
jgi:hypothetical protein